MKKLIFLSLFVSFFASGDMLQDLIDYTKRSREKRLADNAKYGEVKIPKGWDDPKILQTMKCFLIDDDHLMQICVSEFKPFKAIITGVKEGCEGRVCEIDFNTEGLKDYYNVSGRWKQSMPPADGPNFGGGLTMNGEVGFDDFDSLGPVDDVGFSWAALTIGLGGAGLVACCIASYYGFPGCCFIATSTSILLPPGSYPDKFHMIRDEQRRKLQEANEQIEIRDRTQ